MSIGKIDTCSTRGASNSCGYIANSIRFDEDKMMCYSSGFVEDDMESPICGGIIVLSNEDNSVGIHKFKACIDKVEAIMTKNNISRWSLGRYMHTKYTTNKGIVFDESSVSVWIQDVTIESLILIAENICKAFLSEMAIIKPFRGNKLLFVTTNNK